MELIQRNWLNSWNWYTEVGTTSCDHGAKSLSLVLSFRISNENISYIIYLFSYIIGCSWSMTKLIQQPNILIQDRKLRLPNKQQ